MTLFPDAVDAMMNASIIGRAQERGFVTIRTHQIREFTTNRQMQVDDYPYGGGRGAVMQADPLYRCWRHICDEAGGRVHTIYMSPCGRVLTQQVPRELKERYDHLILVCGHYEGVDQRFLDECVDEEISMGDFVVTGGEIPAMALADCLCRMVPGVLPEESCYTDESHWNGLLEYPQYTRPEVWEGRAVPQVLLGGDHQKIDAWRSEQSRERTRLRRPELYEQWCRSHPVEELPKWKRGENMRLVKTDEQFAAAAHIFVEGRRATCAENWTPEYCASLNEEEYLLQLRQEKAAGWACYLHTTKEVPDGIVSINHKVGHVEHLFVTEEARGRGIGMKMLDFARKKLSEHEHPVLSVLNTNTRAIALYTRMGWEMTSGTELEFTPEQYPAVVKKCALVWMRYEGGAQK